MSFKISKCATCKKYKLIDEAPWSICDKYTDCIPSKLLQNTVDSTENIDCDEYEYNPKWNTD